MTRAGSTASEGSRCSCSHSCLQARFSGRCALLMPRELHPPRLSGSARRAGFLSVRLKNRFCRNWHRVCCAPARAVWETTPCASRPFSLLAPLQLEPDRVHTIRVRTLSPITVYKTDEQRHTVYFSPHDAAFAAYVRENARRKFAAYMGREPNLTGFDIHSLGSDDHAVTVIFKGTRIRGYAGRFQLSGSGELLRFLYDAGVGSKNSEGCGMIEVE